MAAKKVVLRTAMVGDVFRVDDKTGVTHEGTEFVSETAAAEAVASAARNGVQLYVVEPTDPDETDDATEQALIASGLFDEKAAPKAAAKVEVPAQNQGGGN